MWTAFGRSVNTYFAWLSEQVGADRVVEMAERLGITFRAPSDAELARRRGRLGCRSPWAWPRPPRSTWPTRTPRWRPRGPTARRCRSSRSPTRPAGRSPPADPDCEQVLDPDVARAAADAARCPVGEQSTYGALRRRHRARVTGDPRRPAGRRQDRQLGARTRRRRSSAFTAAARGGRDRREPGRPEQQRRRRRPKVVDPPSPARWPPRSGISHGATSPHRAGASPSPAAQTGPPDARRYGGAGVGSGAVARGSVAGTPRVPARPEVRCGDPASTPTSAGRVRRPRPGRCRDPPDGAT